jgi:hypothetical protein
MYLTRFHKKVLREIWKNGQPDYMRRKCNIPEKNKTKIFDLESYMKLCQEKFGKKNRILYQESKNLKEIKLQKVTKKMEFVYYGYRTLEGSKYFIIQREEEMILLFKELASLLKMLYENDLVNIVNKKDKEGNKSEECIPLYIDKGEPFDEGLKVIRDYIGKDIQVREGYRKFKMWRFLTQQQKFNWIIAIVIPIVLAVLTGILNNLDVFKNINTK